MLPIRRSHILCFTLVLLSAVSAAAECARGQCPVRPDLYPIGWLPYVGDLKSWRNYDPTTIPGVGRLVRSTDGSLAGERLSGDTCEILSPGKYIFVMKYQANEIAADYIENTDILYLKTREGVGQDYIRHSQVAGGFPVFCAGELQVGVAGFPLNTLSGINELLQVNNYSGHYKPPCKCLGVLLQKLFALNVNTGQAETRFMGDVADCR